MLCWLLLFTLVKLITITTALPNLDVSPSEGDLADRGEIAGILLRENKLKKEKSYLTIIANEYKDDELVRQSVCIATHYDPTGAKVSTVRIFDNMNLSLIIVILNIKTTNTCYCLSQPAGKLQGITTTCEIN